MRRCISAGGSTEIVHAAMPVSVRQLVAGSAGCVGAPCQTRSATSRWESVAKMRPLPPSSTGGTDWSASRPVRSRCARAQAGMGGARVAINLDRHLEAAGAVREEGCRESAAWLAAHACIEGVRRQPVSERAAFDLHAHSAK